MLTALEPGRDPEALAYVVRTHLPLVQVPPGGSWGFGGSPAHTLAETWLGKPLNASDTGLRTLVHRYLAAFGPATVKDIQTWSGLVKLQDAIAKLKPELRTYQDEQGNELLDLPDLTLPYEDMPAPPRFLPEYDNFILSHADRSRVIPEKYKSNVFLSAGRVRATFLLNGFVAGTWKVERASGTARLIIEPFEPLAHQEQDALVAEAERLIRFIEDTASTYEVQISL